MTSVDQNGRFSTEEGGRREGGRRREATKSARELEESTRSESIDGERMLAHLLLSKIDPQA